MAAEIQEMTVSGLRFDWVRQVGDTAGDDAESRPECRAAVQSLAGMAANGLRRPITVRKRPSHVFGQDPRVYQTTVTGIHRRTKDGTVMQSGAGQPGAARRMKRPDGMQMVPVAGTQKESRGCRSGADRRRVFGQPGIRSRCSFGVNCRCENQCSDNRNDTYRDR